MLDTHRAGDRCSRTYTVRSSCMATQECMAPVEVPDLTTSRHTYGSAGRQGDVSPDFALPTAYTSRGASCTVAQGRTAGTSSEFGWVPCAAAGITAAARRPATRMPAGSQMCGTGPCCRARHQRLQSGGLTTGRGCRPGSDRRRSLCGLHSMAIAMSAWAIPLVTQRKLHGSHHGEPPNTPVAL
jgi:hypothetical protein